jgi:fumarate reductase flavoprotein subunit
MEMTAANLTAPADRCDVVVVGGGIAGMVAATRCAIGGLAAVVLERLPDERYVCNTRLTGGIFHLAHHGIHEPAEKILAASLAATEGAADPALLETVVRGSGALVSWLAELGVRFIRSGPGEWQSRVLAPPTLPQLGRRWQGRSGDVLLRTLEARLERHGGRVLRGHRALHLARKDGLLAGIEGVRDDGSAFALAARHCVIADGGFQANLDALARHITSAPQRLVQRNARSSIGDGLAMAAEIGGALTELSRFYGHVLSRDALDNDLLWPFPWVDELARTSIVVGPDARRFVDEGWGGVHVANAIARLRDPASAAVVFDHAAWEGPGRSRVLATNPHLPRAGGTVHRAATLPALAAMAGLPAALLEDEVARYNAAVRTASFDTLAPVRSTHKFAPLPIATAPFYAIPVVAGITYTMGGIRIDANARVVGADGTPIPGVYAAGSAVGGIEGGPHAGYVGGLCKAGVTALRAADHILAHALGQGRSDGARRTA